MRDTTRTLHTHNLYRGNEIQQKKKKDMDETRVKEKVGAVIQGYKMHKQISAGHDFRKKKISAKYRCQEIFGQK